MWAISSKGTNPKTNRKHPPKGERHKRMWKMKASAFSRFSREKIVEPGVWRLWFLFRGFWDEELGWCDRRRAAKRTANVFCLWRIHLPGTLGFVACIQCIVLEVVLEFDLGLGRSHDGLHLRPVTSTTARPLRGGGALDACVGDFSLRGAHRGGRGARGVWDVVTVWAVTDHLVVVSQQGRFIRVSVDLDVVVLRLLFLWDREQTFLSEIPPRTLHNVDQTVRRGLHIQRTLNTNNSKAIWGNVYVRSTKLLAIVIVIPVLTNTTQERFYLRGGPVSRYFRSRDFRIESFLYPGIR